MWENSHFILILIVFIIIIIIVCMQDCYKPREKLRGELLTL